MPGRGNHSAAFDAARGVTLLHGGDFLGDTWTYDGSSWRLAEETLPRTRMAAVWDVARREVVAVSAWASPLEFYTLTWDGRAWRRHLPANTPTARTGPALAFDERRGRAVLFGGFLSGPGGGWAADETWEWDGSDWRHIVPAVRPPGRWDPAMAYDVRRQRVLLFGGTDRFRQALNDLWEWDGSQWTRVTGGVTPPPRSASALAYDRSRGVAVLFGGTDATGLPKADTWEWDSASGSWRSAAPAQAPPARAFHSMAFDEVRGRVLVFGGEAARNTPLGDTWEWDGTSWTQVATVGPDARAGHALVYDRTRRQTVAFGGNAFLYATNDTWVLSNAPAAKATLVGNGCGGLGLTAYGPPAIGNGAFALDVRGARQNAPYAVLLSPAAATIPLGGGCTLLVNPTPGVALPAWTNSGGFGAFALPIPDNASLLGAVVHGQAAAPTAGGPLMGYGVTGRVDLDIGR